MNADNKIQKVSKRVVEQLINALGSKLYKIILYGSYARGDFDYESDFDVMVLINCSQEELREYRALVAKIANRVSLEDELEISLMIQDRNTFEEWQDALPFYRNVKNDGVILYGT